MAVIGFTAIVALSILLSTLFGQSLDQFAFTDGFSFSVGGTSALLAVLLADAIEEVGWRGYGEGSVASYFSWFTESIIEREHNWKPAARQRGNVVRSA